MPSPLLQRGNYQHLIIFLVGKFNISGVNRMTEVNWTAFFPVQTYSSLFRFEHRDILTLIAALRIPSILHFPNGYESNW